MPTQAFTAQQPDHGAALILGAVLGLLLASAAAVAVGSWQYRKSQMTVVPTVSVPAAQGVTGYPATGQPYGGTNAYATFDPDSAPANAAPTPQPATFQLAPQPTVPNANSNQRSVAPAQASAVAPTLLSPDVSSSVELPTEEAPTDSDGE